MARKNRKRPPLLSTPEPGDPDYLPLSEAERRAHADALVHAHEGHGCDEHAGALCQAGEYYAMLGEHQLAEQMFKAALDHGGPVPGSIHGFYASFLLDQERQPEAFDMIEQARRLHPDDPDVFNIIGETLLAHDHPQQAARWFTTGLVRQIGSLTDLHIDDLHHDPDLARLTRGRLEARQTLGMTPDHVDELAQQHQQMLKQTRPN
jgi:tetratricopeptide (TPR) repeat protein